MPLLAKHVSIAAQDKVPEGQDWICLIVLYIERADKNRPSYTKAAAP